MYAQKMIRCIKKFKDQSKKLSVSTQVDFSFGCVIRSRAGLDNVIPGRCTQFKKNIKKMYWIHEIRKQKVLDDFKYEPNQFKNELDSEEAIKKYYSNYYSQLRTNETKFPVDEYATTIVDLLGKNGIGQQQYERTNGEKIRTKLPQAFSTAGKAFEVISNDYKISVVVPYNDEARELLSELSREYLDIEIQKKVLRQLQRYTVGISETRKEKLGNAIYECCDGEVMVLCDGYYDEEVGVVVEPNMGAQFF